MIDSGLLAGVSQADDVGNLSQRAIAQQLGLPLTVFTRPYLIAAVAQVNDAQIEDLVDLEDFDIFCEAANKKLEAVHRFSRSLQSTKLAN